MSVTNQAGEVVLLENGGFDSSVKKSVSKFLPHIPLSSFEEINLVALCENEKYSILQELISSQISATEESISSINVCPFFLSHILSLSLSSLASFLSLSLSSLPTIPIYLYSLLNFNLMKSFQYALDVYNAATASSSCLVAGLLSSFLLFLHFLFPLFLT